MSTETESDSPEEDTYESEADDEAAKRVERRCGIALVPGGVDD